MSMLFLAIPLTLFVLFVLPVWLWLHYNNRTASGSLSQNEQQRLLQLTDDAKRMRERIQALEAPSRSTALQTTSPDAPATAPR